MSAAQGPLPPLQTLRAFIAVAETHSFTVAARRLGLTQTAISHQIAQLEAWLGDRLFLRDRRSVSFTAAGAALYPELVETIERLERTLSSARRHGRSQRLRISTTPEFGTQWLAPRLDAFRRLRPGIEVSVTLEYRRARPADDEADIAIWLGTGGVATHAERLMLDEELVVSSPAVAARLPPRNAILAAPLLRYDGARHTLLDWRRWYAQLFGDNAAIDAVAEQVDFDGGPGFASFSDMLDACRRGEGFALVRSSLVSGDLTAGTLVRSFVESLPSDLHYHLVSSPAQRSKPEVAAFRNWILAESAAGA